MNEKILVGDDEKELADLVEVYLKNDGYTVMFWQMNRTLIHISIFAFHD